MIVLLAICSLVLLCISSCDRHHCLSAFLRSASERSTASYQFNLPICDMLCLADLLSSQISQLLIVIFHRMGMKEKTCTFWMSTLTRWDPLVFLVILNPNKSATLQSAICGHSILGHHLSQSTSCIFNT